MDLKKRLEMRIRESNITEDELKNINLNLKILLENKNLNPSEKAIKALSEILHVPKTYLQKLNEKEKRLDQYLSKIANLLENEDEKIIDIHTLLDEVNSQYPFINDLYQETYFHLLECWYYLLIDDTIRASHIYANKCLVDEDMLNQHELPTVFIKHYYIVSYLYFSKNEQYKKSHDYSLKLIDASKKSIEKANAYYYLGKVQHELHDYLNGIDNVLKATKIFESEQAWNKLIKCHASLSTHYWGLDRNEESEEALNNALAIVKKYNVKAHAGTIYHNLGLILRKKGELNNALENFIVSLDYMKVNDTSSKILIVYRSIINALLELKNIEQAEIYLEESKPYCEKEIDHYLLKSFAGRISYYKGHYAKYEKLMKEVVSYFDEHKISPLVDVHAKEFADYLYKQRQYKKSTHYYRIAMNYYNERYDKSRHK